MEALSHLSEPPPQLEEPTDRPSLDNIGTIVGRVAGSNPIKRQKMEEADESITFIWVNAEGVSTHMMTLQS